MPIYGTCPKCGRMGTQVLFRPHLKHKDQNYMKYNHSDGSQCYIGRVHTTEEAMNEIGKPDSVEEYDRVMKEIILYADSLSRKTLHGKTVRNQIKAILKKYGH